MDISQEQMGSILPISYVVLSFGMLFPNVKVLQFSNKITKTISSISLYNVVCGRALALYSRLWSAIRTIYGLWLYRPYKKLLRTYSETKR